MRVLENVCACCVHSYRVCIFACVLSGGTWGADKPVVLPGLAPPAASASYPLPPRAGGADPRRPPSRMPAALGMQSIAQRLA